MSGSNTARRLHTPVQEAKPASARPKVFSPCQSWRLRLICSEIAKSLEDNEKKQVLREDAYVTALNEGDFSAAQRIAKKFFPDHPELVERAKAMKILRKLLKEGAENGTLHHAITHAFSCGASLRAVATELSAHRQNYPQNYAFSL